MWGNIDKKLLRVCQDQKPDKMKRVTELLDKGANINAVEQKSERLRGMTPLLIAINNSDKALARLFIERGADIHIKDEDGADSLSLACLRGMKEIAEILLDKGMDINAMARWQKTPLMNACYYGHTEMAQFLLERKADINLKGNYGYTALHWAMDGNTAIASRLLENGADINAASNDGTTPLMRAISHSNDPAMARLLLEHKADTSLKNNSGQTAYEIAKRGNNQKVLSLFAEHQQNGEDGIKWEKVSNTAVKRNTILDDDFSQLEHLDFQTRMYVTIIKNHNGAFSHASQPFNSVARATVEDAANFLRRNGGTPDLGKATSSRKPGKMDL